MTQPGPTPPRSVTWAGVVIRLSDGTGYTISREVEVTGPLAEALRWLDEYPPKERET